MFAPTGKIISCSTGSARSCYCCGKKYTRLCDYPMVGRVFAGLTCDNKICDDHAIKQTNGKYFCPYHEERENP